MICFAFAWIALYSINDGQKNILYYCEYTFVATYTSVLKYLQIYCSVRFDKLFGLSQTTQAEVEKPFSKTGFLKKWYQHIDKVLCNKINLGLTILMSFNPLDVSINLFDIAACKLFQKHYKFVNAVSVDKLLMCSSICKCPF